MKDISLPLQISINLIKEIGDELGENHRLHLRKGRSESLLHILLKILSACYLWDVINEIIVEPNYKFRNYRPDLLVFGKSEIPSDLSEVVDIWVECKTTSIKKMQRLSRYLPNSKLYWFHTNSYFQAIMRTKKSRSQLKELKNLNLIGIKVNKIMLRSIQEELKLKRLSWIIKHKDEGVEITGAHFKGLVEFINF